MLIFNKEFRTEEKTISALIKKIAKSATVSVNYNGSVEKYEFDTFDVSFDVPDHKILVTDKVGDQIMSMDCHYDAYDEMQEARSNWFHQTLENARRRHGKEQATKALKDAANSAAKAVAKALDLKSKKRAQQAAAKETLDRIKGL